MLILELSWPNSVISDPQLPPPQAVMTANPAWRGWEDRTVVLDGAESDFREMDRRAQVYNEAEFKNEPGFPVSTFSVFLT